MKVQKILIKHNYALPLLHKAFTFATTSHGDWSLALFAQEKLDSQTASVRIVADCPLAANSEQAIMEVSASNIIGSDFDSMGHWFWSRRETKGKGKLNYYKPCEVV